MPRSARTQSRHLTTNNTKDIAMAKVDHTLCPEDGQRLSTLYDVLTCYHPQIPPNHLRCAESHMNELSSAITAGMGAIGSLIYWALESDDYEAEQLRTDIRDIGYFFAQLAQIALFAEQEKVQLRFRNSVKSTSS